MDSRELLEAQYANRQDHATDDRYQVGAVADYMYGEGKCAWCRDLGEPVWSGRCDFEGSRPLVHVHAGKDVA